MIRGFFWELEFGLRYLQNGDHLTLPFPSPPSHSPQSYNRSRQGHPRAPPPHGPAAPAALDRYLYLRFSLFPILRLNLLRTALTSSKVHTDTELPSTQHTPHFPRLPTAKASKKNPSGSQTPSHFKYISVMRILQAAGQTGRDG